MVGSPSRSAAWADVDNDGDPDLYITNYRQPNGRRVRSLEEGVLRAAGSHEVVWNGRDDAGNAVASAVYICRLEAGGQTRTQRMVLAK